MSNTSDKAVAQSTPPRFPALLAEQKLRDSAYVIRINIKRICAIGITDVNGIIEVTIEVLSTIEDGVSLFGFRMDEVLRDRNKAYVDIKGICAIDIRSVSKGVEIEIYTWTRIEAGQVLLGREIPVASLRRLQDRDQYS
jgi:hypothetical protein